MTVRIEKSRAVWTIIHDRPEARNAMDPKSADELDRRLPRVRRRQGRGRGGVLRRGRRLLRRLGSQICQHARCATYPLGELDIPVAGPRINGGEIPRGPLGPSRLELDKPVIAAIEGPAVAGGMELGLWCDFRVMAAGVLLRRLLPPLGRAADRRRHRAPAAHRRPGAGAGDHPHRAPGARRGMPAHRPVRVRHAEGRRAREGGGAGARDRALPAGVRARRPALGDQEPRPQRARWADPGVVQRPRGARSRTASRAQRASRTGSAGTATSRRSTEPTDRPAIAAVGRWC